MSYWILYLIALVPLVIGAVLSIKNSSQFTWQEWIFNSILCFILAGAFHLGGVMGQTSDHETWSGKVTSVKYIPSWVEFYRVQHTVVHSSGSGKTRTTYTTTYYTSHTDTHPEQWIAYTDLPDFALSLDIFKYNEIRHEFGGIDQSIPGRRTTSRLSSRMISGDPNDYITNNTTKVIVPVTNQYSFENRVKAASTLFSFSNVPNTIKLPEYPENLTPFISGRLVGSACLLDIRKFDELNTRLGASKQVNVILVGLNNVSSAYGKWLEAKWVGGKKNDIVIVWGGSNKRPDWVYAFGWTDRKTVLRDLELLITEKGISNDILPDIEKEIRLNYTIKNWHDFDYIKIPVSNRCVFVFVAITFLSQCFLLWWYGHNEIIDYTSSRRSYRTY